MVAEVVNTKGMNLCVDNSVLITLEAYFVFFSAPFFSSCLSTGKDMFDGAFGCVIPTCRGHGSGIDRGRTEQ